MSSTPKRIAIDAPGEMVILAARHLDATEGRVQPGAIVDSSTRSAITTVLRYVSEAHNSPVVEEPVTTDSPRRKLTLNCNTCGTGGITVWADHVNACPGPARSEHVDAVAEVARLRAGEEDGWDPACEPTPGQWIARFNRASPEERLHVAQQVIENAGRASRCFQMAHEQHVHDGQQAQAVLARVRDEVDRWKLNTLGPQTMRAVSDIDRALRGAEDPIPCSAYRVPATSEDSGLCAGCGMYDYKHQEQT